MCWNHLLASHHRHPANDKRSCNSGRRASIVDYPAVISYLLLCYYTMDWNIVKKLENIVKG